MERLLPARSRVRTDYLGALRSQQTPEILPVLVEREWIGSPMLLQPADWELGIKTGALTDVGHAGR